MNIECNGDCFQCEHMKNEDVDLLCPLRIVMLRTARIEQQLSTIISMPAPTSKKKTAATVTEIDSTKTI